MKKVYPVKIILLSDTLVGNAEGHGATIDNDCVFDDTGLPIIPGKRVKGLLREQADLLKKHKKIGSVEKLFGDAGLTDKNAEYLSVSSFVLEDYQNNKEYLDYLLQEKKITRSEIIDYFTSLRMMTKIEDGIAAETSLRTSRVLKKGFTFYGELEFNEDFVEIFKNITSLTRRLGALRNRGFGHIQFSFINSNSNV